MRRDEALRYAVTVLRRARVDSPSLDAIILLAHALHLTKENILTYPEKHIKPTAARRFLRLVTRRAKREPTAYLTGHKEFYGLDFVVNRSVLIPRPETETLVEAVLLRVKPPHTIVQRCGGAPPLTLIDIGTGSGAIIIALAKELQKNYSQILKNLRVGREPKKVQFFATDISDDALRVARANARRHGVKITFKKGNLLKPLFNNLTIQQFNNIFITANLPYLPTREWRRTEPEIRKYEPRAALDGGPDGLKYYRQLFAQLKKLPVTGYWLPVTGYPLPVTLFFEFDPEQTTALTQLAQRALPRATIEIKKDLAGRNRVLIVKL